MGIKDIKIEEEVDFEIQNLSLSKYELEDGTILRICEIPNKIFRAQNPDDSTKPSYIIAWQTNISAIVKPNLKGVPSKEKFDPKTDKLMEIEFIPLKEPINYFWLGDGTIIKSRIIVNSIKRAEKRNQYGEPIYWSIKNNNINIIDKSMQTKE